LAIAKPLANTIIDEVKDALQQWGVYAEEVGVTKTYEENHR